MHPPAKKLRAKIADQKAVLGTMLVEFGRSAIMGVTADAGIDFVVLDAEHGFANPTDLEATIEAGYQSGICTLFRPSNVDRGMITKALDAGAAGVLIPFCATLDEVKQAVRVTKYAPVGQRGVHLLRGHTRHRRPDAAQFMAEANRDLLTIIQIELASAVEIVEQIAALEGIDGLYIGPGDLSVDLGVPGQWNAPPVLSAIRRTAKVCQAHGKIAGCHVNHLSDVPMLREFGVAMFGYSCDLGMYQAAVCAARAEFDSVVRPKDLSEVPPSTATEQVRKWQ